MPWVHALMTLLGLACLSVAAGYGALSLLAVLIWRTRRAPAVASPLPPVTVLKPLCGAEPGLYEHLRSFCEQDYPQFQVIFGVQDPADPALAVVQRLVAEFPALQIDVVIDPRQHGSNRKISNLINMLAQARYELLAMADSDTYVGRDYLRSVTAPLLERGVGVVTCLYRGVPTRNRCSRLGAMYINEWYMPSVLLAWLFGHQGYVSGQTLCLRRATLEAVGGLPAVVNHLADDYHLGERVRGLGLRIVLSPYRVEAEHDEPNLASLTGHEMRWMSTLRVLRPRSFRWIFLSFSLPLSVLGVALSAAQTDVSRTGWALFCGAVTTRLLLHVAHRVQGERPVWSDVWLLPARELLLCWVWVRSLFNSRVSWRGSEFDVDADGVMRRLS